MRNSVVFLHLVTLSAVLEPNSLSFPLLVPLSILWLLLGACSHGQELGAEPAPPLPHAAPCHENYLPMRVLIRIIK